MDVVSSFLEKIEEHVKTDDGAIVQYSVAEIVEKFFGSDERGKYLLAVVEGRAK